jgi:putative addiction module component (TIGR02574 family)
MIAAAEIEQMSLVERMEAMELLWRSLASEPGRVISPAWHGKVLQKRLARIDGGKAEFLTVAQLKNRLSKRRR